jgi:PmbA protein
VDAKGPCTKDIEAVAEQALEGLRRRGARGDVHATRVSGLTAEVVKGKLRNCRADGRLHLSVRAVRNGRIGFHSSTDLTAPDEAAARAVEVAAAGEELEIEFPTAPVSPQGLLPGVQASGPSGRAPLTFDPCAASLDAAGLARLVQDLAARAAEATPGAQIEASGVREVQQSLLVNSSGGRFQRESTHLQAVLQLSRFSATDVLLMYQGHASAQLLDPGFADLPERLRGLYAAAGEPAHLAPGKRRVVFAPEAGGVLLGPMFAGLNGVNVNLGTSPLAGRLGEQALAAGFTLTDQPWLDWSPTSALWDDEGVPASPKRLFDGGVLKSYLHDLRSAARGRTASTGNGRRRRGEPPHIAPFNVVIGTGKLALAQLLREAEDGLYVLSVIGGVAGIMAGAFSHPVGVAYLVKDGRLAGRVKDVAISGNVYELCRGGLVGIEDRTYPAGPTGDGGMVLAPHILLDGVDVSGR